MRPRDKKLVHTLNLKTTPSTLVQCVLVVAVLGLIARGHCNANNTMHLDDNNPRQMTLIPQQPFLLLCLDSIELMDSIEKAKKGIWLRSNLH